MVVFAGLAQPPSSHAERTSPERQRPECGIRRAIDSVFTAIAVTRGMDCLLIAAAPPSSRRRKHGQLHASRVQARSSQATFTYRSTSHWLCGGRMADDVFDSAILEQADHAE